MDVIYVQRAFLGEVKDEAVVSNSRAWSLLTPPILPLLKIPCFFMLNQIASKHYSESFQISITSLLYNKILTHKK